VNDAIARHLLGLPPWSISKQTSARKERLLNGAMAKTFFAGLKSYPKPCCAPGENPRTTIRIAVEAQ
jgi:hypothetical protein